jgi:queuine tRNA-ribosyltransferase
LRHLFKAKELLFSRLVSINNLNYIKNLMYEIRNAIKEDRLYDFYLEMKKNTTYFI